MKEWFLIQKEYNKKKQAEFNVITNNNDEENYILFNIPKEHVTPILEIAKNLVRQNIMEEVEAHPGDNYIEIIKKGYKDHDDFKIDEKKLQEYMKDPEFQNLRKAGRMMFLTYNIENKQKIIKKQIKECLKKYFPISWETADLQLNAMMPGQLFPLHMDAFRANRACGQSENKIMRQLVMLEDQQPGQVFLVGEQYLQWKQGDVINVSVNAQHGGANFGYWPRFTLKIQAEYIG